MLKSAAIQQERILSLQSFRYWLVQVVNNSRTFKVGRIEGIDYVRPKPLDDGFTITVSRVDEPVGFSWI